MSSTGTESTFILTGLGNIGRSLLEILHAREKAYRERYGLSFRCLGVADSTGAAYDPAGIPFDTIVAAKRSGRGVASLPAFDPALTGVALAERPADLLLEATPTNLHDGQPGLDMVRAALRTGKHAVLASKGALVLAYAELAALSDLAGPPGSPCLRFSGAVGGALPTINFGRRDLAGAIVERAELLVNGTTQVILEAMADGQSFEQALALAQSQGIVEPDPSLDVDGWDAANKLVIFANAVLGQLTRLDDLRVQGIRAVTTAELQAARSAGGRISVVGEAVRGPDGTYALWVAPKTLGPEHPLARLGGQEMGFVIHSDLAGRTAVAGLEDGPVGTCQAMIRDLLDVLGKA